MKIGDKVRISRDVPTSQIFLSEEGRLDHYIVTDVFVSSLTGNSCLNGESASGRLVGGPVRNFELLRRIS